VSAAQAGYATLIADATPLLSPYTTGSDLPGGDRGACLRQGQQARPTSGLQRQNAVTANGESGWAVTLPNAARGLSFVISSVDTTASIDVFALPAPGYYGAVHLDTIDGGANDAAYALAPDGSVTFSCTEDGLWVSQ